MSKGDASGALRYWSVELNGIDDSLTVTVKDRNRPSSTVVPFGNVALDDGALHVVQVLVTNLNVALQVDNGAARVVDLPAGFELDDCGATPSASCTVLLGQRQSGSGPILRFVGSLRSAVYVG